MHVAQRTCMSHREHECRTKNIHVAHSICMSHYVAHRICMSHREHACRTENMHVAQRKVDRSRLKDQTERERDRQIYRDRDRETERRRQTDRQTDRPTDRHRDTESETETGRDRERCCSYGYSISIYTENFNFALNLSFSERRHFHLLFTSEEQKNDES